MIRFVPLLMAFLLAAGCGKSERQPVATQVAAKVNADEITVHQINDVLARTPNVTPAAAERVKREILERLIDQQLAKQQAIGNKLDRTPTVQQALEAARTEILARAHLERIAANLPKPSPEEVKKYFSDHPELFAQRRIFSLEEILFVSKDDVATAVKERVAKAASMAEIAEWLKSQGVSFVPSRGVRAAEQIPLELLPRLQRAKDGEILLSESGDNRQVIRVVASKMDAVDEATATPRIQQYLANRRASAAIAEEMKQLKQQAKIQYLGEFAPDSNGVEARQKAQAEAKAKDEAKAKAEAKARDEAEAQARAQAISKARAAEEARLKLEAERKASAAPSKAGQVPMQSVEKGVKGL